MIIYNANENGKANICIFGEIISGVDEVDLVTALSSANKDNGVDIWVSSPGGDLQAAFPMVAAISNFEGPKEIHTCGIVASAATLLLCANGARVIAHKGSVFMIHQSLCLSIGNADDARKTAEMLDACDDEIVNVLSSRINKNSAEILSMLKDESWISSSKALELGLVDAVVSSSAGAGVVDPTFDHSSGDNEKLNALSLEIQNVKDAILSEVNALKAGGQQNNADMIGLVKSSISAVRDDLERAIADANAKASEKVDALSIGVSRACATFGGEQVHYSKPAPSVNNSIGLVFEGRKV